MSIVLLNMQCLRILNLAFSNDPITICGLLIIMSINVFQRKCLSLEIKSKYTGSDECVRIGQTVVE